MRADCLKAVSQAIGRALTSAEAQHIEARVGGAMRRLARSDPAAWQAKSTADRLMEAGQAAAAEIVGEAQLKKERLSLQVAAHQRVTQKLADLRAHGIDGLEALDRLVAFHADTRGNTLSIETQARAIERDALRQMLDTLEASHPKWFGLFENNDGVTAIVRELFGEHTGNTDARAGAESFHKVGEAMRQRFNRAGADVGNREDWGLPHHHSQVKVAKAGRDAWVADTLPELNRDAYFNEDGTRMNPGQLTAFLNEAWTTIASGGANKLDPGTFTGSGARANRGSESRQIHFKDADSYMRYQQKYGERSLYEVLVSHIAGIAKDVALVETMGPNPDHTFRFFRDTAVKEAKLADPTKVGKIDQRATRTDSLYNVVSGKTQPVASEWLAKTFDTLRAWLIAARLGSSVITSFSDDATLHLTAKLNNLPSLQVLANELSALNPANRTEERLALRAGLAMNTLISSLNRFGQQGLGSSFASKLSNSVLRLSGLNAMTEARRRAFGVTMMSSMGAVTRSHKTLNGLDPIDHRILLAKGITDADLVALGNPQVLKEQAAMRLLGAVLEETDVAVVEPGAKERAITGAGLQRGTWKGELTRSFFLFKSFPLAMIERHWQRGMSLPNLGGRAAYLATLLAATTVLGMASLQVSEVLAGRDPRNLNPFAKGGVRNWIAAMLKGGSLGIYGDFLFSDSTQHGSSPLATVTGPVLGLAEDFFNLTQGNIIKAAQSKDTHFGAEAVRFVKSNLPGASLWYAKAALDHLIFHQLQEYFSPGYLRRMKQRAYKEFGQKYWWQPGEVLPSRAPDPAAALGE